MNRLLSLFGPGLVIADGAWGTEFQKRGLALGQPADLWNLTRPEDVEAVAQAYVDAGSQVILSNTFRGNPVALAAHRERRPGRGDQPPRRGAVEEGGGVEGPGLRFHGPDRQGPGDRRDR